MNRRVTIERAHRKLLSTSLKQLARRKKARDDEKAEIKTALAEITARNRDGYLISTDELLDLEHRVRTGIAER